MSCATSGRRDKLVDACKGDSGGPVVREVLAVDFSSNCLQTRSAECWWFDCSLTNLWLCTFWSYNHYISTVCWNEAHHEFFWTWMQHEFILSVKSATRILFVLHFCGNTLHTLFVSEICSKSCLCSKILLKMPDILQIVQICLHNFLCLQFLQFLIENILLDIKQKLETCNEMIVPSA